MAIIVENAWKNPQYSKNYHFAMIHYHKQFAFQSKMYALIF